MPTTPRPKQQRAANNKRYTNRRVAAGMAKLHVLVPILRMAELDQILVEWRRQAKMSLQSDQPTADQILRIHAVCRTLRLKLPITAFATRLTADSWLHEMEPRLGDSAVQLPRKRRMS
jgi:hypothetical protein